MDKEDIINYVMETPGNSNPAVLGSMLNSYGGGGVLPTVTSEDNGDVLTVVNGEWNKAAPSGGSSQTKGYTYSSQTIYVLTNQTVEAKDGGWYVGDTSIGDILVPVTPDGLSTAHFVLDGVEETTSFVKYEEPSYIYYEAGFDDGRYGIAIEPDDGEGGWYANIWLSIESTVGDTHTVTAYFEVETVTLGTGFTSAIEEIASGSMLLVTAIKDTEHSSETSVVYDVDVQAGDVIAAIEAGTPVLFSFDGVLTSPVEISGSSGIHQYRFKIVEMDVFSSSETGVSFTQRAFEAFSNYNQDKLYEHITTVQLFAPGT